VYKRQPQQIAERTARIIAELQSLTADMAAADYIDTEDMVDWSNPDELRTSISLLQDIEDQFTEDNN
jgi:hypothetical protein